MKETTRRHQLNIAQRVDIFILRIFLLLTFFTHHALSVVPQIKNLNVKCDTEGMSVSVEFDRPFNGIIFSKGYYADMNCRYVKEKSDQQSYSFKILSNACGTSSVMVDGKDSRQFENVVIFQNDPIYQEVWDSARLLSCRYLLSDDVPVQAKKVIFKPFQVDMLDVITVPMADFAGDEHKVDCWMDVTKGRFPSNTPISGPVKVGENLTLAIYIRDSRKNTDIRVKDCYAYDNEKSINDSSPALLQLSSDDGCPLKPKLMDVWRRTSETGDSGATVIAFSTVTAFKFPEHSNVHLTCNVELCKKECAERCPAEQQMISGDGNGSKDGKRDEDGKDEDKGEGGKEDGDKEGDDKEDGKDESKGDGDGEDKKKEDGSDTPGSSDGEGEKEEKPDADKEDSDSDSKSSTSAPPKRDDDEGGDGESSDDGEGSSTTQASAAKDEKEDEDEKDNESSGEEGGSRGPRKEDGENGGKDEKEEKEDKSDGDKEDKESSVELDDENKKEKTDDNDTGDKESKEEKDDEEKATTPESSSEKSNHSDDDSKPESKGEDGDEDEDGDKKDDSKKESKDEDEDDEDAEESREASKRLLTTSRSKIKKSIRTRGSSKNDEKNDDDEDEEDDDDHVFLSGGLRSLVKSSATKVSTTTTPIPKTPLIIIIKSDKSDKKKDKSTTRNVSSSDKRSGSLAKSDSKKKKKVTTENPSDEEDIPVTTTTKRPRTTTEVITASGPRLLKLKSLRRTSRFDEDSKLASSSRRQSSSSNKKREKSKTSTTTTSAPRTTTESEDDEDSIPKSRVSRPSKRPSVRTRKSIKPKDLAIGDRSNKRTTRLNSPVIRTSSISKSPKKPRRSTTTTTTSTTTTTTTTEAPTTRATSTRRTFLRNRLRPSPRSIPVRRVVSTVPTVRASIMTTTKRPSFRYGSFTRSTTTSTTTRASRSRVAKVEASESFNDDLNEIGRPLTKRSSSLVPSSSLRKWDEDALFNPLKELELYEPVRIRKNSRLRRSVYTLFDPRQFLSMDAKHQDLTRLENHGKLDVAPN